MGILQPLRYTHTKKKLVLKRTRRELLIEFGVEVALLLTLGDLLEHRLRALDGLGAGGLFGGFLLIMMRHMKKEH